MNCICGAQNGSTARFCSNCGRMLVPPPGEGQNAPEEVIGLMAGERKQVTILFSDFCDFSGFSARLDPEELSDITRPILEALVAIILARGGETEKIIGDAVMAAFGGTRSREEDPAEAVRAGLEMQNWLNARRIEDKRFPLQMRVGINTGVVVVGSPDPTREGRFTGDTIVLAKRLEENAPPGGVLVSRETYRHIGGYFEAQALPPLQVKGKLEPVETYLILRDKPRNVASQIRGVGGVETEMVGRQEKLNFLLSAFEQTVQHKALRVVSVEGEAGIGKSRLLREFQKKTALLSHYSRFFYGRTTSESASQPFGLIRDLFFTRFEIQETDLSAVAREKFERGLADLLAASAGNEEWSRGELTLDIHFTGQLLGLDFSASPHLRHILGDAEQIRQRAFHGFSRLFGALCQCPSGEQPPKFGAVCLVLEDLHWCDEGSLELIENLMRNSQNAPLMALCSARPAFFESRPNWCEGLPNATRLKLDPLSAPECNALVESILIKAPEIPAGLKELLTGGTDGNPFYIEEMINMLIDQKVITSRNGRWQFEAERMAGTLLPTTLTGVLQARLESLPRDERMVLQRASVVGRVFWDKAVEHIGSTGRADPPPDLLPENIADRSSVARALEGLRRKELVFTRESSAFAGSVEYMFKHELLRNVAYENLLQKSRRQHHARIAEWLKEQSGDRVLEFAGLLAAHLERASQWVEAAEWHGRAGQQARLGYAPAIAMDHFKKALQLLPADHAGEPAFLKKQLDWREGLGETLGAQARFSEALDAYAAMRDLARQLSEPAAEARAWNGMAFLHERRGDNRASIQCAEHAEKLAGQAGEAGRIERVRAMHYKGWACYRLADAPAVLALGEETLKLCVENSYRRGIAASFRLLGAAHLQLAHLAEADNFFKQGLDIFQELGDQRNTSAMWSNRGECAYAGGDYQTALPLYETALGISRQIGHQESELIYLTNRAGVYLGLNQFELAERDVLQVLNQTVTPNSCAFAFASTYLSEAYSGQGRFSEAVKTARQAIAHAEKTESNLDLGYAWRALGRIGAGMSKCSAPAAGAEPLPDLSDATPPHCFAESLRVFQLMKARGEQGRTLRDWAEYELEQGDLEPARCKLHEAREIFVGLGADFEIATTEKLIQQVNARPGSVPDRRIHS